MGMATADMKWHTLATVGSQCMNEVWPKSTVLAQQKIQSPNARESC